MERQILARTRSQQAGRACPLCPGTSDVNLLRYRERVIDLNAQISDGALDLCVAEQELDGPKQRRLRPPEGMGAEKLGIKSDSDDPFVSFRQLRTVFRCPYRMGWA